MQYVEFTALLPNKRILRSAPRRTAARPRTAHLHRSRTLTDSGEKSKNKPLAIAQCRLSFYSGELLPGKNPPIHIYDKTINT